VKLKLDLHEIYNRGDEIERALQSIIEEAVAKAGYSSIFFGNSGMPKAASPPPGALSRTTAAGPCGSAGPAAARGTFVV
jgi:hypothetical protein